LSLQWSPEALDAVMPEAPARLGRMADEHVLLDPNEMVRREILWRALSRGDALPLGIEELFAGVLAPARRLGVSRSAARGSIERVKEALALRMGQKWTLTELGDIACMSSWHLAHVFRREVGVPVHTYVLRLRLAHAVRAVIEGEKDLMTIAVET